MAIFKKGRMRTPPPSPPHGLTFAWVAGFVEAGGVCSTSLCSQRARGEGGGGGGLALNVLSPSVWARDPGSRMIKASCLACDPPPPQLKLVGWVSFYQDEDEVQ